MKRILIALGLTLALLLLVTPTIVSAAGVSVVDKTGDGGWIGNTWQVSIYPSESKSTTLTLYNSSSSSLTVEIPLPDTLDNGNLTFELDKSNFTMSGKSYMDITLTLRASSSTTPGTYAVKLLEIRSEVPPPRPSRPSPSVPTPEVIEPVEEPEIVEPVLPEPEEPEEPIVEEPVEPEVPTEPEEPIEEPEEPVVEEPEVEEPIEPEEPEAEELIVEEPKVSWLLTISMTSSLVVIVGVICWLWLRRRRRRSQERV